MAINFQKIFTRVIQLAFIFYVFCLPGAALSQTAQWQSQSMVHLQTSSMPLLPYLDYYIDESLAMDIEEASAPSVNYQTLNLENLPRVEGVMWLRFTIAPLPPDSKPRTFLLDMGQSVPGTPMLYDPAPNEFSGATEWRENTPSQRNILLLPEEGQQAITCYLRLEGLPGPWFSPMIRTPQNAASSWSNLATAGAILTLAVVAALCLLRWVSERGQWRIWTVLYVGVAFAQSVMGMPAINEIFTLSGLGSILAPGIALMLLPHVGRHLIQERSRGIDIQLFLLSLPGAALAILPLIPDFTWIARWLDLWPLGTVLFIPTALGAWIMGLYGAKRFLCGCLLPPLFTSIGLLGLDFGVSPTLLASSPLWGVALSALLIAATRAPWNMLQLSGQQLKTNRKKSKDKNDIINLDHPLDDPNLRMVDTKTEEIKETGASGAAISLNEHKNKAVSEKAEMAIRTAIDGLLRDGAALEKCSLAPEALTYAEKINASAKEIADIISGDLPPTSPSGAPGKNGDIIFNLQTLLRSVHDSVAAAAESSGESFSWYMPPLMHRIYRGNAAQIENVLHLLLENAARCSEGGTIRISARRVPESADPGHILFIISDNGRGFPPKERSSLALVKAWELAGKYGGYFDIEAGPKGVTIALSMHLKPVLENDDSQKTAGQPHALLVCEDAAKRGEIVKILEDLPCAIQEAASANEAAIRQSQDPSPMLIVIGNLASPAGADMARQFKSFAREAGFPVCGILAVTEDDSQWNMLKPSGFTHAMLEPVDAEALKNITEKILRSAYGSAFFADNHPAQPENKPQDQPAEKPAPLAEKNGSPQENKQIEETILDIPDWLNENVAKVEEKIETPIETGAMPISTQTTLHDSAIKVEEIGEPVPVAAPEQKEETKPETEQKVKENKEQKSTVGEKDSDKLHTETSQEDQRAQASITDFIVGVERQKETIKPAESDEKVSAPPQFDVQPERQHSDPVVSALIINLDAAMNSAMDAFAAKNCAQVVEATSYIVEQSEKFGLRLLSRMAQCVERAAKAEDLNALSDILPELAMAVERNKIALTQKKW